MSKPRKKRRPPKRVLALPDLEQSKTAVLNTLTSKMASAAMTRHNRLRRPKWANDLYLIEAEADGNPTMDNFESREGPVLALTLVEPGKLGPKLIPHSDGSPCADTFEMPDPTKPPQLPKPGIEWGQCGTPAGVRGTADSTSLGVRNRPPGLIAYDI
jgi:hypothetical protein